MNTLNIFKMFYWSWRTPLNNLKNIKKIIEYSWQRITRGYCDYDRYDIDWYLLELIPNILEDFANKTYSYPCSFRDLACWQEYLRYTADRFKNAKDFYELSDSLENYTTEQRVNFFEKSKFCLKDGFGYLEKHFWNLWD